MSQRMDKAAGEEMRILGILTAFLVVLSAAATPVSAKGCIKGAIVGGAAGHYAHHHGLIGAAAGCIIGRHHAHKRERANQPRTED
jgi:hypothetical protein